MSIALAFMAGLAAIAGWWLAHQRLMSRPWLEVGLPPAAPDGPPVGKVGLGVFLAVVGALFALLGSAFAMRVGGGGPWGGLRLPAVVWLNTSVLVMSSIFLRLAVAAARSSAAPLLRASLAAGGLSALAFLGGQLIAWRMLAAAGEIPAASAAAGFFFLITALHGLHILGGLAALARVGWRVAHGAGPQRVLVSVQMCATYWHFLLIVWLGMLALFLGWAGQFIALCGAAFR